MVDEEQIVERITFPGDLFPSIAVMQDGSYQNLWAHDEDVAKRWLAAERMIGAIILAWRARQALLELPDLVGLVRTMIEAPERGADWVAMWAPMRISAADHVDRVYRVLVSWSRIFAHDLKLPAPSRSTVGWRAHSTVVGFKPGTAPGHAKTLISVQSHWLLDHEDEILTSARASEFHKVIVGAVGRLTGFVPPARRRLPVVHPRPCPNCLETAVEVFWLPSWDATAVEKGDHVEDPEGRIDIETGNPAQLEVVAVHGRPIDVEVKCAACKYSPPATASQIARWIA